MLPKIAVAMVCHDGDAWLRNGLSLMPGRHPKELIRPVAATDHQSRLDALCFSRVPGVDHNWLIQILQS
jgi:hypothetical protein